MNEEQKNIETCLAENILAEVASVPQDPQFRSLVNESLDPLKQQAAEQEGDEAYEKVVWTHKPYTFTSQVAQMKSNLILLLRRLWRFPFGRGTIRSLADMWQHYITRLQGSETYGIPSRLSSLTDLPSAPLLLSDRKISGVPEAEDGMSYVRLLCGDNSEITELTDNNYGWTMTRAFQMFSACKKVTLNCTGYYNGLWVVANAPVEELHIGLTSVGNARAVYQNNYLKKLYAEDLEYYGAWDYTNIFEDCQNLEEIYFSGMKGRNLGVLSGLINNMPALWLLKFGDFAQFDYIGYGTFIGSVPNLIHLEFKSLSCALSLAGWNPSNALDASRTDLIEEGSTATNNLQQFLTNFRSFIILRLANRKSTTALTLTLSAAVYNAVTGADSGWASLHTLAELGITDNDLTELETDLGITTSTIYATWLDTFTGANGIHWDINKAN